MIQRDREAWIEGGGEPCKTDEAPPQRAYRLILLGAPGVGKGTQAEFLSAELKACQLSTGDVFRAARAMDPSKLSPAMLAALGYMQRGELVPDDTVVQMVRERRQCLRCPFGFLLDGFPRTVSQAEALEDMLKADDLKLDAVISFELPMEQVIARLSGRRTCRQCKSTFHVTSKPSAKEGVCDKCNGELYQRVDDQPDSIRVRLQAYEESTSPLADYYSKKGLLLTVSAEGSPEDIFGRTMVLLRKKVG